MSGTLPKSCDKYEEDTSRGQVSTVTDNIVADTQQAGNVVPEMSNEQSNSRNLAYLEEEDGNQMDTDQLPPHVVIETVSYEDYIKQRDGQIVEEGEGGDNIEVIKLDDDDEEDQPRAAGRITTNRFITVTVQCDQCNGMFSKEQLSAHLWDNHGILPFRCAVKDCAQSFNNAINLAQHIGQSHQGITNWQCGKCDRQYGTYARLSKHNNRQHQLGHFMCSIPACPFTGETKMKVSNHYAQHKKTINK